MKNSICIIICMLCIHFTTNAQLTVPANGGSVKASVGEMVGITNIDINYGRPLLRGREGKIWGEVVHEGFIKDAAFGREHEIPWRAGANENTTMEFSTDVMIEGKPLKAGKYGFHIAYYPTECILIFSNNTGAWGSYMYEPKDDVLRVKVKPVPQTTSTDRLTYTFSDQTDSSAKISLVWEKLAIPFTVSTELQKLQIASIEREMNSAKVFNPQTYMTAANYYYTHDTHLDDALFYSQAATRILHSFNAANLQHNILKKMNKTQQADSVLKVALNNATMGEMNNYGRTLLSQKAYDKAFEIFKENYSKHPDEFITNIGMMRGYSAQGNYKKALQYADKAKLKVPNEPNKQALDKMIETLKQGKDINS